MNVLTLNAGSSSIKYHLFKASKNHLDTLFSGLIEGIGEKTGKWHHSGQVQAPLTQSFKNHAGAFKALNQRLQAELDGQPLAGIGHRVVHGGSQYFEPTLITTQVLKTIQSLSILAPIHNPINAQGIEFAQEAFKDTPQFAIFDTGFHHSLPERAYTYPIEHGVAKKHQIRRYGFHGINHEYVARTAAKHLNKRLSDCDLISLHLGNGASACLIKNGLSVDISMGMTPLSGLMMGTRCGDIDPAIPLYLQKQGFTIDEVDVILNKKSGLLGIAGDNDMRHICQRADNHDPKAALALSMYVYCIQKFIGSYYSQTPQLDALIFTGGVGENAVAIREKIITPLQHLGFQLDPDKNQNKPNSACENIASNNRPILVIKGNEEQFMAEQVRSRIF